MKDIFKIISVLLLVVLITIISCFIFIPDVPKFNKTSEYKYIENNKNNLNEVIVRTVTLLGERCYKIDVSEGYNIFKNISFKKKANVTCTDSDMYMEFYFKNDSKRVLQFECGNLLYKGERYELKNKIVLYNSDEYLPDEIDEGMIIISNKDMVQCK